MASYAAWKPYENFVQSGAEGPGMVDGKFISGAYTGIFAGPPRLSSIGGVLSLATAVNSPAEASQIVYPVGICQNLNLSNNRQISRIFELGSHRSYFIPGRTIGQLGMSRIMYHGPSILRVLYAYYQDLLPSTQVPAMFPFSGSVPNQHDVQIPPGYENFYVNLASDLFDQPIGLLVMLKDNSQNTYGAFYLESCYIPNHTLAVDAQGVIMQESVAVQFELVVPISLGGVELIT
jgi:hypothetical protein